MSTKRKQPAKRTATAKADKAAVKWWKRPFLLLAGFIGALLAAIATAFGTGAGDALFHSFSEGTPTVVTGPALSVNVYHETFSDNANGAIAFPNTLKLTQADLRSINASGGTGIARWLSGRGGYENLTEIKLTVTGRRPCRILDIRADILSRATPLSGTLFEVPPPGGTGGAPSYVFTFDLDGTNPAALMLPTYPGSPKLAPYFKTNTFTLAPGEQQTFQIYAATSEYAVRWEIGMTILDGNKVINDIVKDNGGVPFRTTATTSLFGTNLLTGAIPQKAGAFYQTIYTECYGLNLLHNAGLRVSQCNGKPGYLWVETK